METVKAKCIKAQRKDPGVSFTESEHELCCVEYEKVEAKLRSRSLEDWQSTLEKMD